MDYDDDGTLDFISGSYDPGGVYLFRGLGEGKYAKRKTILDENDVPLVHHPVEMAKYQELGTDDRSEEATEFQAASFGSWAAAADWDADKDLDILIGSLGGGLFLRENIGTRDKPRYSGESVAIKANGQPLKEDCHAAPVVADWDGDGIFDLVIGSGDGSIGWYKNVGSVSEPEFSERKLLVPPAYVGSDIAQPIDQNEHSAKFFNQILLPDESPTPGARAQICVCDYNKDGKLDLIVGDYSKIDWTRELSEKEQSEFDSIKKEQKSIEKKLESIEEKLFTEKSKDLKKSEKEKLEKEFYSIFDNFMKLEKRKSFFLESRSTSFIWLYLRKTDSSQASFVSPKNKTKSPDKVEDSKGQESVQNVPVNGV